jgi:predicted RecB family nuclease
MADIPRLRAAAGRHELAGLADAITDRHFDAYLWILANARLPVLSLGLKPVSSYLGFRPSTDVADGLHALMLYHAWLASSDETIKATLTAYNRDDVDALAHAISRLVDLSPGVIDGVGTVIQWLVPEDDRS